LPLLFVPSSLASCFFIPLLQSAFHDSGRLSAERALEAIRDVREQSTESKGYAILLLFHFPFSAVHLFFTVGNHSASDHLLTSARTSDDVRKALKYLQLLVDENALFNAALGAYDLDLVIMVAQVYFLDMQGEIAYCRSLRRIRRSMSPSCRRSTCWLRPCADTPSTFIFAASIAP
jgi:hypothetical protein